MQLQQVLKAFHLLSSTNGLLLCTGLWFMHLIQFQHRPVSMFSLIIHVFLFLFQSHSNVKVLVSQHIAGGVSKPFVSFVMFLLLLTRVSLSELHQTSISSVCSPFTIQDSSLWCRLSLYSACFSLLLAGPFPTFFLLRSLSILIYIIIYYTHFLCLGHAWANNTVFIL